MCCIPELSSHLVSVLLSPSSRQRGGENSSFISLMELLSEHDAMYAEAVNSGLKLTHQLLKVRCVVKERLIQYSLPPFLKALSVF